MKKFFILVFALICCLPLAACANKGDGSIKNFVTDTQHCVVSIQEGYGITLNVEGSDLSDEILYNNDLEHAEKVNGNDKKDGFLYFYMPINTPFHVTIQGRTLSERAANCETLLYLKLNNNTYKAEKNDVGQCENIFTCSSDTEITPVYYDHRTVGVLLYEVDSTNLDKPLKEYNFFDESGKIKEQSGVYYLYGTYDFEPDFRFWTTNLEEELLEYNLNKVNDSYSINVEIGNLFGEDKAFGVVQIDKIYEHGYMLTPLSGIVFEDNTLAGPHQVTTTLQLGKHEIKIAYNQSEI